MAYTDYLIKKDEAKDLFEILKSKYTIFAPKRIKNGGRYCNMDTIMYENVQSFDEIEYKEKSTYSAKEALLPMTENLFYFTEDDYTETKQPYKKEVLVFARACDINAIKHLDDIFIKNGPFEDMFYKRRKNKVHYALLECQSDLDRNCFCVSCDANKTDNYTYAFRFNDDGSMNIKVEDDLDLSAFSNKKFDLKFPEENELKVIFPQIKDDKEANLIANSDIWDEYNSRCIGCGSCTTSCSTCTCFTTRDVTYTLNRRVGERRRTNASCMTKDFDLVAGGGHFRNQLKERYRYKIMHKIYAHNKRFGDGPMCVGCGRCSAHCPQLISYPETINKVSKELEKVRSEVK
ncbi:anaerobic sulfite reductase subunit AsrA [Anaerococcus senegalensis]|uniref:anaerobic sulfite reductase subunit AsrA n=1 Tax=Anaerococcus senegalensis TaxID=1288120 RepID=UPI0002F03823|nr:anaerobic sulfite reductase subunit AsrA [Anaerococcus senegalensis]